MTQDYDPDQTILAEAAPVIAAPDLAYRPQDPVRERLGIGLIGCGGISAEHLTAYRSAGYRVVALCDLRMERADERRRQFFPEAVTYTDYRQLIARDDIQVVDVATHPPERPPLIEAAIRAGKHVLSQKPFVLDLGIGERLADLADAHGVLLAVNQNGRWAPHFSYLRQAIAADLVGLVGDAQFAVHWDHNWVSGTRFDQIRHLMLYDFAIHWFDILTCFMGELPPRRVFATVGRTPTQRARPGLLAQVAVEYDSAQATLSFNGDVRFGSLDSTYVAGSRGSIRSEGPNSRSQVVSLYIPEGVAQPQLEGTWFPDGFHGTMGELLLAIEQHRQPYHSARNNLRSLALCFAAIASAELGDPVVPGSVPKLIDEALGPA